MTDGSCWDQGGSDGYGRKLSRLRCMLKVELSTLGDGLDVGYDRKRGLNDVWTSA